jgi:predicted Fe-Mo cluster-binding NifX family protein
VICVFLNILQKVEIMSSYKVAVPSNNPGGMKAGRSDHFGHSDIFTLLEVEDNKVIGISTHENVAHDSGGCMTPVRALAEAGVKKMIVGGMGAMPLAICSEIGLTVYFAGKNEYASVGDVAAAFVEGRLPEMNSDQACNGGSNCHH